MIKELIQWNICSNWAIKYVLVKEDPLSLSSQPKKMARCMKAKNDLPYPSGPTWTSFSERCDSKIRGSMGLRFQWNQHFVSFKPHNHRVETPFTLWQVYLSKSNCYRLRKANLLFLPSINDFKSGFESCFFFRISISHNAIVILNWRQWFRKVV